MCRAYLISFVLFTMFFALSTLMLGQANALVIADHCTVVGNGTYPNGDLFSGSIIPVEGVNTGTWEHWMTCESTVTCDDYTGALHGLCNAYCEAMNCTGDAPEASGVACEQVRQIFFDKGGDQLPCEPCGYFVGDVDRMFCWTNGVSLADFWGTGSLN